MDVLSHSILYRQGQQSDQANRREQVSIDFVINGVSLLKELVRCSGGHSDFIGRLVIGLPQFKSEVITKLRGGVPPDTETGRIIIYSCPECGDIGCGAYSAVVERMGETYTWQSFAYENGYEPAAIIEGLGPFTFERQQYDSALTQAASAL